MADANVKPLRHAAGFTRRKASGLCVRPPSDVKPPVDESPRRGSGTRVRNCSETRKARPADGRASQTNTFHLRNFSLHKEIADELHEPLCSYAVTILPIQYYKE
jgi:hypothetical protein